MTRIPMVIAVLPPLAKKRRGNGENPRRARRRWSFPGHNPVQSVVPFLGTRPDHAGRVRFPPQYPQALGGLGLALPLAGGTGTRFLAFEALPISQTPQGVPGAVVIMAMGTELA